MRRLAVVVLAGISLLAAAEPVLTIPSNLRAEGIPPIPLALLDRLNQYNDYRTAGFEAWHPTKREILITTRFGDTLQVHRVAAPGGARRQLTFFRERAISASYPPRDAGYFVFRQDSGGGEFYQIHRFDLATGRSTLLTDGKSRNGAPVWSRDGKLLVHTSTRRNGADSDLWLVDPLDPSRARLALEVKGGGWEPVGFSPDGKLLTVNEFRSVSERFIWLVNLETGAKELLTPAGATPAVWAGGKFSPGGESIFLLTDKDSEFQRLARMDLATRKLTFLFQDQKWDVDDADISPDGKLLAYALNEDGASVPRLYDLAGGKPLPAPKLPYGVIGNLKWRGDGQEIGFDLSSARGPSDVYSYNVASGRLERWTYSETGGLDAERFSAPEIIRWKSFDGREIPGFLYRPPGRFTGPRPVVINIHGGPEAQSRPVYIGRWNYFLQELGVAVIYPNVRGSTGYGKEFVKLDNGVKREDSVKDIGALLDWIAGRKDLDAGRVMVTGGSYGGYMTLAAMTHYNDRLRCGLDVVGIANFVTFLERTESYRRDLRRVEYGDERDPKIRDFLSTISPANNARKIGKPLFIVQGRNDPRVPYTESEQMVAAVRKNGSPVWYLLAADEGHGFAKKSNTDVQFGATVLFIEEHLLK